MEKPNAQGKGYIAISEVPLENIKVGDAVLGCATNKPKFTSKDTPLDKLVLVVRKIEGKLFHCTVGNDHHNRITLKHKNIFKLVVKIEGTMYATPILSRQYNIGLRCLDGRLIDYEVIVEEGGVEISNYSTELKPLPTDIDPEFRRKHTLCAGAYKERMNGIAAVDKVLASVNRVNNLVQGMPAMDAMTEAVKAALSMVKYLIDPEDESYSSIFTGGEDLVKAAQDIIDKKKQ